MEIFGSGFDDSMFGETRDRVSTTTLLHYNAKFCEPEWFCDASALDTDDSLEKQKIFKFRGDLAFRQGCYQKSLDAYSGCLEWLPDNNLTIRRDILEGMARCYTHLGHKDKALEMTDLLSKDASNTCHLTCLLLLKVSIHQHFGALGSKISSLQDLCSLLHFNPWYWYDLGLTCLDLLEADKLQAPGFCSLQCDSTGLQPGSRREVEKDVDRVDRSEEEESDRVWLKACMCLIRTRLLLRILRQQQSSFVLQRSENTFQRTEELLQQLNPKEGTRQTLTEVMSEDLIPEKMREENQDGESLAGLCMQSFKDRWWNKILLTGVLQTDGPSHYRKIQTNTQQNVTD